jgi:methionyl aminopeptidase
VRASSTIKVLNDEEIEGMRKVCKVRLLPLWWIECIALIGWLYWIKISREVLDIGAAAIRPGISTDEIGKL